MVDMSDLRSRIEGDDDIASLRRDIDELRASVERIESEEPGDDVRIVAGRGVRVDRLDGVWMIGEDGSAGYKDFAVCEIRRINGNGRVPTLYGRVWTLEGTGMGYGSGIIPIVGLLDGNSADVGYAAIGFSYEPLVADADATDDSGDEEEEN